MERWMDTELYISREGQRAEDLHAPDLKMVSNCQNQDFQDFGICGIRRFHNGSAPRMDPRALLRFNAVYLDSAPGIDPGLSRCLKDPLVKKRAEDLHAPDLRMVSNCQNQDFQDFGICGIRRFHNGSDPRNRSWALTVLKMPSVNKRAEDLHPSDLKMVSNCQNQDFQDFGICRIRRFRNGSARRIDPGALLRFNQLFEKQEIGGSTCSGFKNGKQLSESGFPGFWDLQD